MSHRPHALGRQCHTWCMLLSTLLRPLANSNFATHCPESLFVQHRFRTSNSAATNVGRDNERPQCPRIRFQHLVEMHLNMCPEGNLLFELTGQQVKPEFPTVRLSEHQWIRRSLIDAVIRTLTESFVHDPRVTAVEQSIEVALTQLFTGMCHLTAHCFIIHRTLYVAEHTQRFRKFRMSHLSQQECQ